MKTENLIAIVVIIILFSIAIKMYFEAEKNINRYINILKKETIILFPIGVLMLMYQIYKSGQWDLSQETNCYIVVFFNLVCILFFPVNKFLKYRWNDKGLLGLSLCIVFAPVVTIAFLVVIILGIK